MDIQITRLTKQYGKFHALHELSLNIGHGMFGLLGPNGAGKTTLMKILTTILPPTSGTIQFNRKEIQQNLHEVRQKLGYLPQDFGFYKSLNAYELLDYIAMMKNIPSRQRKTHIEHVLAQVNLTKDAKRRVGGYSGGMKQRLGIAQALIGDPDLLVVDEPTAGLDPEERIRFRNLLARISGERTIILSTHIVADIEVSCQQVGVLNKGRLIFHGSPSELKQQAHDRVWEVTIPVSEYERLERQYTILSSRAEQGHMILRVISSENPLGQGISVNAELEDGYIAVMSNASLREIAHVSL